MCTDSCDFWYANLQVILMIPRYLLGYVSRTSLTWWWRNADVHTPTMINISLKFCVKYVTATVHLFMNVLTKTEIAAV